MEEFHITDSHSDHTKSIFCFFALALKEKKKRQAHILAHLVALHTSPRFATKRAKIFLPAPSWAVYCLADSLFFVDRLVVSLV